MNTQCHMLIMRGIYGEDTDALEGSIGAILEQHGVMLHPVEYPFTTVVQAMSRKRTIQMAYRIADAANRIRRRYGKVASFMGHSNAAQLAYRAAWHDTQLRQAHLLHGALDETYLWGLYSERVNVFYDERDRALGWGARIPAHDFGRLGKVGHMLPISAYPGDFEVVNHPVEFITEDHGFLRHDSWLRGKNAERAAEIILRSEGLIA